MGKKKREHIVFDQMLKPKRSIPIKKINTNNYKKTIVNKENDKSQ